MYPRENIVPCRGREMLHVTDVSGAFTAQDLDAIAPLAPEDSRDVGEDRIPSSATIERLEARIAAARRLKHGK